MKGDAHAICYEKGDTQVICNVFSKILMSYGDFHVICNVKQDVNIICTVKGESYIASVMCWEGFHVICNVKQGSYVYM